MEQLSAYGLKNFMFDVAKVSERGVGKLIKNSHLQMLFTSNSHPARLLIWDLWSLNPSHPNISVHILHVIYNSLGADKENLFINQENFKLVIISFILMTLLCDTGIILLGEIRCWSPSGVKGLIT